MIKVYETKEEKKAAFKRSVGLRKVWEDLTSGRLTSLNDRGTILSISLSNGIDFLAYRSKQKITIYAGVFQYVFFYLCYRTG